MDPSSSKGDSHTDDLTITTTINNTSKIQPQQVEELSPASIEAQDRAFLDHGFERPTYRVYKRRFFGLVQLTLLNIIVSWGWLSFAANSTTSADFFQVSITSVNWLGTAFLLAFVAAAPATIYVLDRYGTKTAILVASVLVCVGNWIRYAGCRADQHRYGIVMFGQILIGLSQPFVLALPPRYSEQWFTASGRIAATALPSLANPLGGALAQLIDPFLASDQSQIPFMVLIVSIISTIICVPSLFIPATPPIPPSAAAAQPRRSLRSISEVWLPFKNLGFHVLFWPFAIYVSAFNAFSTVINNVLYPYGFSETDAGIAGAILIVAGLVVAAVTSPVLDRFVEWRITFVKVAVPIIAIMYLVLIWIPQTQSIAGLYIICGILGAASFSLVPIALEFLVDSSWPQSGAEVTSVLSWTAGQLGGAIFIIIMDSMEGLDKSQPPGNLKDGMIFLAVLSFLVLPFPMILGYFGTGRRTREEAGLTDI